MIVIREEVVRRKTVYVEGSGVGYFAHTGGCKDSWELKKELRCDNYGYRVVKKEKMDEVKAIIEPQPDCGWDCWEEIWM